jgi:hypothetical protein
LIYHLENSVAGTDFSRQALRHDRTRQRDRHPTDAGAPASGRGPHRRQKGRQDDSGPPWHENVGKRQVKSPKVYIADSGLLHTLLNLRTQADLEAPLKVGASWEGWVLEQIIRRLNVDRQECFFWATHAGAELDLLVVRGRIRLGFEAKRTVAPSLTASMRHALQDLRLSRLDVIHAGDGTFGLADRVRAVAASRLLEDLEEV